MEESNKSAIDLSSKKSRIGNSFPLAPYSSEIWLEILASLNKIATENRNGQHIILPSFVNEFSQYTHTERISNYGSDCNYNFKLLGYYSINNVFALALQ